MLVDKNAVEANSHEWCIFKFCWQTRSSLSCLCKADERYRSGRGSLVVFPAWTQGGWTWQAFDLRYLGAAAGPTRTNMSSLQSVSSARGLCLCLDPRMRVPVHCGSGVWAEPARWALLVISWKKINRLVFWFREQNLFYGILRFVVASF